MTDSLVEIHERLAAHEELPHSEVVWLAEQLTEARAEIRVLRNAGVTLLEQLEEAETIATKVEAERDALAAAVVEAISTDTRPAFLLREDANLKGVRRDSYCFTKGWNACVNVVLVAVRAYENKK